MKKIKLTNSIEIILIDDNDFEITNLYSWHLGSDFKTIQASVNGRTVNIGRFLLGYFHLNKIDHIDRNIFNCQRNNLRLVDDLQNAQNRGTFKNNTSGYKGVFYRKDNNKWRAIIGFNNKLHRLGQFNSKEEIGRASCRERV